MPGISGPPIPAGGSADYDFPLRFGGTFWMHSHQGLQEQGLMTAPLIIHDQRDRPDEQEVVVMLADFSFTPAEQIFENLRKPDSMAGMAKPAGAHGLDVEHEDGDADVDGQSGPDLNDVKYDAFLANVRTLADPEIVKVEPGGRVLLRIINGSSMSAFHVGLGALDGELIAVDGFEVAPIRGREFPVAVAQRLDIRVSLPPGPGAYPVLAQLEGERGQTGIILVAGGAAVSRIPDAAETPSPALTLDLERSLRAQKPLAPRKADRVHTLNLTGEMAGYVWSINNVVWNKDTPPLAVAEGERVELVFVNQTPMPHPMHLHGHEFQVVEIDGERFPGAVRDTILVTARPARGRGVRRQQSGLVGAPLPLALPPGGGDVHHDQVRVTAPLAPSVWVFLARGRFVAKHPDYAGWISLDFLGFSRPNSRLINRLRRIFREKFFLLAFP